MTKIPEIVALHEIPLSAFSSLIDASKTYERQWNREFEKLGAQFPAWRHLVGTFQKPSARKKATRIEAVPGFSFVAAKGSAAIFEDAMGRIVGGIFQNEVMVLPEFRRRGLASEAVILAFETGIFSRESLEGAYVFNEGRATLLSARRKAVERARALGVDAREDVSSDHADPSPMTPS